MGEFTVCIFEIDHPATQRWKRPAGSSFCIVVPPNLRFVPVDFETTSLADALRATDFDFGNGAVFCSWLGVTQYLTPTAISAMLEFVVALPRSSEIVFSFIVPLETLSGIEAEALAMASRKSAEVGEPWLTTFRTEDLKSQLRALGFSDVIHLTPEEAHERYLKNRRDGPAGAAWQTEQLHESNRLIGAQAVAPFCINFAPIAGWQS